MVKIHFSYDGIMVQAWDEEAPEMITSGATFEEAWGKLQNLTLGVELDGECEPAKITIGGTF